MFKKTITYKGYDGNERKEDFFFNLNEAELMEMELRTTGGMKSMLEKIVSAQDTKRIIEVFKDVILRSYGEKSADGRHFLKYDSDGHKLANLFAQTDAYSKLFMELVTNTEAATAFINGIIPQGLIQDNNVKQINQ